jgi:hypothetical protein
LNNREALSASCDYNDELQSFVYVIEGCQMVALSVYIVDYWYDLYPLGTEVFVNLVNGNYAALEKSPMLNPDYIIGYQIYNDLRISVSHFNQRGSL